VALVLLVPAALLVRRPPALDAVPQPGAALAAPAMTARRAFATPQFIVLAATFFACCAAHSGPIFHTVSYAIACGLAPLAAVTIYSVEGLAGLGGRLLLGIAGDRYGAKPVLVAGLAVQALAAGSYLFTREISEFYAVAIVFGLAYGGVMPLYSVLAREYFPLAIMGTILGATAMISSLGMALGPAIGGWIYDTQGEYAWLYIASAAIGLGAVAIALFFPPVPARATPALQPA
ncbi:MFS transporter, partial [Desertibaculum subflavum]|uniref:MFS transporter n=1 Tax=Desertibaculum subflavum TaxID=2268458 RepID=UPI0013C467D5